LFEIEIGGVLSRCDFFLVVVLLIEVSDSLLYLIVVNFLDASLDLSEIGGLLGIDIGR
jgi:hypothetical protein